MERHELTFILVYNAQHTDPDGVSVPADSLSPGTGPLKGPFGQDAVLTHGAYAFPQHFVNTLPPPPQITNIEVASDVPDHGFHSSALGDVVEFRVTFSEAVTASGIRRCSGSRCAWATTMWVLRTSKAVERLS